MRLIIFGLLITTVNYVYGECNGYADLVIAVPGGFQVPHHEFTIFEEHLHDLIRYFSIEPDQFNIGLILYGESTVTIATPQPFKNRLQMNTRITLLTQRDTHFLKLGFRQKLQPAIQEIRHILTQPPDGYHSMNIKRPNVTKIGIIFTYGPTDASQVQAVIDSATKAKEDKILLYALTANGSAEDFPHLGTDYCRLFSMNSFRSGLEHAIPDLANGICSSLEKVPRISPSNCFPGNYRKARRIGVTCQVANNMVMPDPNNCAYYYRCEYYDTVPFRFACPLDTLFDPLSGACNQKINVACYNDLSCPSNVSMSYVHPLDCNKYVNCFDDFIPHVQTCPDRQVFDQDQQMCRLSGFGSCIKPTGVLPTSNSQPGFAHEQNRL
ncbi:hypothetical protein ACF0H5_017518 [Mactra antiquata]